MQHQPFRRVREFMAAMQLIAAMTGAQRITEQQKLGSYASRGHGRGIYSGRKVNRNRPTDWLARGVIPGGCQRECARRRQQLRRAIAKATGSAS